MKILKYIFLLLLLALFATTVFISTQKGNFDVKRSIVIKSQKPTVFNFVNDLRNWETFGSWKREDPNIAFDYPNNTVGAGGSYSWKGSNSEGDIKTISIKNNKSIHQKMNFNGVVTELFWNFKDTVGGTKVTWRSKGTMDWNFKILTFFKGGANKFMGDMHEKSLKNLDKSLDFEINTYSIKVVGVVQKLECLYLKQTITSKISDVPKNLRIMLPKIVNFFKKNNISMNGSPFVLYHTFDVASGITRFSVCVPIKEVIFTNEGSDITTGKLNAFHAVRTIMKGDYSHSKEAWAKTLKYIQKNNLTPNTEINSLELYSRNMTQIANPSQWITEIYIPIIPKTVVATTPKPIEPGKTIPTVVKPTEIPEP